MSMVSFVQSIDSMEARWELPPPSLKIVSRTSGSAPKSALRIASCSESTTCVSRRNWVAIVFPLQQSTALAAGPQGPTTNFTSGENRFPSLTIDPDGSAWVSTWSGLVRWKDHRTQTLTSRNGLPCDEVVSAIRDNRATLRLYTKCGFIGIADSELEKWWRQPDRVVRTQVLDVFGGAVLPQGPRRIQPAVAKSPDGRLWFVNGTVLQMIDPSALRRNRVPPPVYVEECVPIGRTTPLTGSFACRRVLGTSKSTTCLAGQPIGTERILPLPME